MQNIAVVKNLTAPLLVGLELMSAFKINIDTEMNQLIYKKESIKGGIRTVKAEKIPPRSQTIINATVNTVGSIMTVPFNGNTELLVANSITEVIDNQTDLLVANNGLMPIEIEPDTQLASYELLDEPKEGSKVQTIIQLDSTEEYVNIGPNINESETKDLKKLIFKYIDAFSINGNIGKTNVTEHKIELEKGAKPFAEPLRRRAPIQIEETRRQVKDMLNKGIIEESNSPWASAYVLAKKKNGEMRLCVDFRKLNDLTKKTVYPLPNIEDCLETLAGKKYYSLIDFASGVKKMTS